MPSMFSSFFRRAEKRRSYIDLMRLDDHLLRDIGVTRSDIRSMMHGRGPAKAYRNHE